jgi:hypothetical protein
MRHLASTASTRSVQSLATVVWAALMVAVLVWLARAHAQIIHEAVKNDIGPRRANDVDIYSMVDSLLGPALYITAGIAPLGVAWGAGAMMFGGKSGPQIMGASIVAVVLVASAKFVAH